MININKINIEIRYYAVQVRSIILVCELQSSHAFAVYLFIRVPTGPLWHYSDAAEEIKNKNYLVVSP